MVAWSMVEVDFTSVEKSRSAVQKDWQRHFGSTLTPLPYVMRAAVRALQSYPHLNAGSPRDVPGKGPVVHLGISVEAAGPAERVPVLRNVEELGVAELAYQAEHLRQAVRSGSVSGEQMDGATFSIVGSTHSGGVRTLPSLAESQIGTLAVEQVMPTPTVVTMSDGSYGIAVRMRGTLCLAWDTAAVNGTYVTHFLSAVRDLLETTEWMVTLPR